MRRSFMARVYRIPYLLSFSSLMVASCNHSPGQRSFPSGAEVVASPIPALYQEKSDALMDAVVTEAEKRIDQNMDQPMLWRRVAQIHLRLGHPQKARDARLKAAAIAEDSTTRSLIADELIAQGEIDAAKTALGQFGYLGTNSLLSRYSKNTKVTAAEQRRLEGPTLIQRGPNTGLQIFPTRLVMQLVIRGAEKETQRFLKPRLDFALQRGSQGGRTQSFHDAILCTFYLGDFERALEATERESPYWRVQTLFCLLVGGASETDLLLFADLRQSDRDFDLRLTERTPPRIRAEIVQRLRKAIPLVPLKPSSTSNITEHVEAPSLGRMAMLAGVLQEWDLARLAAERIEDPVYRQDTLDAIRVKSLPLFAPPSKLQGMSVLGILGQNLSRISRLSETDQGRRLLQQALDEAHQFGLIKPLAEYLAQVAWQYEAWDLIPSLLNSSGSDWFHCAQALKLATYFRTKGDLVRAREYFAEADQASGLIAKRNQRVLLSLETAEEARLLGEFEACDRLRQRAREQATGISTTTIHTEAVLRLLQLDTLRGDSTAYKSTLEQCRSLIETTRKLFPAEADRLRIELSALLVKAGQREESLRVLQTIEAPSLQPHALCTFLEELLNLKGPNRMYTMDSLARSRFKKTVLVKT